MTKATRKDKDLVVNLLATSFNTNPSVNYIILQDYKRLQRVRYLMDYSFEMCYLFGDVFLSEDKKGCALILYPEKKKLNFTTILLDLKLILTSISFRNLRKVMKRETMINNIQSKELKCYLWFIGVAPNHQHTGVGSKLLHQLIEYSEQLKRPVYLETSALKNVPWYQQFGFTTYNEADVGYRLFFMKRDIDTSH